MDHPIADCMSNRHDAGAELSAPSSVAALGIPEGLAEDLFMRRILADRMTTIGRAADALKVSHAVGDSSPSPYDKKTSWSITASTAVTTGSR